MTFVAMSGDSGPYPRGHFESHPSQQLHGYHGVILLLEGRLRTLHVVDHRHVVAKDVRRSSDRHAHHQSQRLPSQSRTARARVGRIGLVPSSRPHLQSRRNACGLLSDQRDGR